MSLEKDYGMKHDETNHNKQIGGEQQGVSNEQLKNDETAVFDQTNYALHSLRNELDDSELDDSDGRYGFTDASDVPKSFTV